MKTINALKIGIQSIFDRIGCNTESVQETLGTHGVTESNMMQYLGIIEQRTNEILQMYSACQSKVILFLNFRVGMINNRLNLRLKPKLTKKKLLLIFLMVRYFVNQ
jgi:hypothetical protein